MDNQRISRLWKKYREPVLYVLFGALTTLVNLAVFALCNLWMKGGRLYLLANVAAWVAAVATAYVTNKLWVFESRSWRFSVLRREIPAFLGARVFSLIVEEAGLFLTIDVLGWDRWALTLFGFTIGGKTICKVILQVVVLIMNFIFSKLVIFKKKAE